MKIVTDVSFVDEKTIRSLNRRWRKIDQVTDVLSFPLDREVGPDKVMRLGDIVICRSQAKKLKHTTAFLIKHAMLHLLGVHHK